MIHFIAARLRSNKNCMNRKINMLHEGRLYHINKTRHTVVLIVPEHSVPSVVYGENFKMHTRMRNAVFELIKKTLQELHRYMLKELNVLN